jgi:adenosyl cobinamide kinase/adenosyl cobinamide phosphate guanylyltransferase
LILITGGAYQGKLTFAKKVCHLEAPTIMNGSSDLSSVEGKIDIINGIHLYIHKLLVKGQDPWEKVRAYVEKNPNTIVIVDELGCGIVPMEASDREWREITGRICCWLANESSAVYRVICGVGTKIK